MAYLPTPSRRVFSLPKTDALARIRAAWVQLILRRAKTPQDHLDAQIRRADARAAVDKLLR